MDTYCINRFVGLDYPHTHIPICITFIAIHIYPRYYPHTKTYLNLKNKAFIQLSTNPHR